MSTPVDYVTWSASLAGLNLLQAAFRMGFTSVGWNPGNKVVQDHANGGICMELTNVARAHLGLSVPWTAETVDPQAEVRWPEGADKAPSKPLVACANWPFPPANGSVDSQPVSDTVTAPKALFSTESGPETVEEIAARDPEFLNRVTAELEALSADEDPQVEAAARSRMHQKLHVVKMIRWTDHGDHERVRKTSYMEVSSLVGTAGCSPDAPYWTWMRLGVIEGSRGSQLVVPGDWVVELSDGSLTVVKPSVPYIPQDA